MGFLDWIMRKYNLVSMEMLGSEACDCGRDKICVSRYCNKDYRPRYLYYMDFVYFDIENYGPRISNTIAKSTGLTLNTALVALIRLQKDGIVDLNQDTKEWYIKE